MKSIVAASLVLGMLGAIGLFDAIHISSVVKGPYGVAIPPLYSNDSDEVIQAKLKLSSSHATIEPSVVLPFMPPP